MVNDIINGITGAIENIGSGLVDLIINFITTIVNALLIPINSLFETLLPDLSTLISNFSSFLVLIATGPFALLFNLFPPTCKSLLLLWLTILIAYYSIIWVYRGIILIPKIVNKIKFW